MMGAESQKTSETNGCKHLKWDIDAQNIGTCRECGEVRQFPWSKNGEVVVLKKGNPNGNSQGKEGHMHADMLERHNYYESHKEEIIADLLSTGRVATREKWGIPTGSTLHTLEKRWLTPEQRNQLTKLGLKLRATPQETKPQIPRDVQRPLHRLLPTSVALPAFPEFSNDWTPEVQLEWLWIYERLARLAMEGMK